VAKNLDDFLVAGWGRCPDLGVDMNQSISRVCPLVRQVYELRRESDGVPPSFLCGAYRKGCGAENWVIETALQEEEDGTRRRWHGVECAPLLERMYASGRSIKEVNASLDAVVDAWFEQRWKAKQPDTSGWSSEQVEFYHLLVDRRERERGRR